MQLSPGKSIVDIQSRLANAIQAHLRLAAAFDRPALVRAEAEPPACLIGTAAVPSDL